jgi:anaerobic dimethyl sulfoxide reductase subunit B (iron-sulfur subunit)
MQIGFYFDQTRCTGCSSCRVACKDWNDIPEGTENWMKVSCKEEGTCPDVQVSYMANTCWHCIDPVCMPVCPSGAIRKRPEDGIVIVDADACIGKSQCGAKCLKACPYNAPQFGAGDNAKMGKCNFCLDRFEQGKVPDCVEACPTRALDAGKLDELEKKYGTAKQAQGFKYSHRTKPAVVLKGKKAL